MTSRCAYVVVYIISVGHALREDFRGGGGGEPHLASAAAPIARRKIRLASAAARPRRAAAILISGHKQKASPKKHIEKPQKLLGSNKSATGIASEEYAVASKSFAVASKSYDVASKSFDGGSNGYDVASKSYDGGSNGYGVASKSFDGGSNSYDVASKRFFLSSKQKCVESAAAWGLAMWRGGGAAARLAGCSPEAREAGEGGQPARPSEQRAPQRSGGAKRRSPQIILKILASAHKNLIKNCILANESRNLFKKLKNKAMLDRKFMLAAAFGLLAAPAWTQVDKFIDRTIDRTTQRVENKVTNKVNTTTDRAVDKTVDKVFEPNKNKTSTTTSKTTSPSTTTSTTTNSSSGSSKIGSNAAAIDGTESSFVGQFQWEIKRYKSDKLVADGHKIINFYVKPFEAAAHVLNPSSQQRENAYILNRTSHQLVSINEKDGTATKSSAKGLAVSLPDINPTTDYKTIGGVSCVKYTGENSEVSVVLWLDESERAPMTSSFAQGMGNDKPEFNALPYLAKMRVPVREGLITFKKTNEKTQFWLNSYQSAKPDEKAFDSSRYLQK